MTFSTLGPRLLAQGFEPIPVAGKIPVIPQWDDITLHADQIAYWAANGKGNLNVGLRTAKLAPVDIDIYDPVVSSRVNAAVRARFGAAPERVGMPPKALLLYAAQEPGTKITSKIWVSPDGKEHRVEVLGVGQQFVADGIHPDTHKPYTWRDGDIADLEMWMLTFVDRRELADWIKNELPSLMPADWTVQGSNSSGSLVGEEEDPFDSFRPRHDDVDLDGLKWLLANLPAEYCDDRNRWRDVIFATHHQFHHTDEEEGAIGLVDEWSAQSNKYVGGVVPVMWEETHANRGGGLITIGSLKTWVGLSNWASYREQRRATAASAATQENNWFARIGEADQATIEGTIAAEIRTAELTHVQRDQLANAIAARMAHLHRRMGLPAIRRMLAPSNPLFDRPAEVDLNDYIPFDLAVPALSPAAFPHTIMTESSILVRTTIENVQRMLAAYGISAYYDVVRKKHILNIPGLSACPDQADSTAMSWIASLATLNEMAGDRAVEFAVTTAYQRPRNIIGDWIKSKPWDGQDRVKALANTLTVKRGFPLDLRDIIIQRWLVSAVGGILTTSDRFYSKGVLVLQGPQSIGKTPWVAHLVPPDLDKYVLLGMHLDPSNRDSIKTAVSHWLVELGEVDSTMNRSDVAMLKAFISQRTDKLRLPYARTDSEFQRRTTFFASVNPRQFLRDESGNVRWWTVPVTAVNFQHGIDLQQLWAQAAVLFEAGESWWLSPDEEASLERCNADHIVKSSIHEMLSNVLDLDAPKAQWKRMNASAVLTQYLGIKVPNNPQSREAGQALRALLGEPTGKTAGTDRWLVPPVTFDGEEDPFA